MTVADVALLLAGLAAIVLCCWWALRVDVYDQRCRRMFSPKVDDNVRWLVHGTRRRVRIETTDGDWVQGRLETIQRTGLTVARERHLGEVVVIPAAQVARIQLLGD